MMNPTCRTVNLIYRVHNIYIYMRAKFPPFEPQKEEEKRKQRSTNNTFIPIELQKEADSEIRTWKEMDEKNGNCDGNGKVSSLKKRN